MKMAEADLLVCVEHVKFRQNVAGKSPLGTLSIYKDRVEWKERGKDEAILHIPYGDIKIQRISLPNKDKVQLQICMHNEDQATFVFMRPNAGKDVLIAERDLIKETVQQNLTHYRQILRETTVKADKEKNDALEAKRKYLQENTDLQTLYRYLVSSKLISPDDFWSLHHIPIVYKDQLGISSGFLSSIGQMEGAGGLRLNLTSDTIMAIFKTYPIVEKKHLELVPHAMTEPEFWTKFFQSHYFHRERDMNEDPNDPFFDCDKNDRREMNEEKSSGHFQPLVDFNYLLDDLGIVSEIRQNYFTSVRRDEDEDVDRLVRRCNYHSGRLLSTLVEKFDQEEQPKENGHQKAHVEYNFSLESEELAEIDKSDGQTSGLDVSLKPSDFETGPRAYDDKHAQSWKAKVQKMSDEPTCSEDFVRRFFDDLSTPPNTEEPQVYEDFFKNVKSQAVKDLKTLYPVTHELLRHFWVCLPATTPEAEDKLVKMHDTLVKFEDLLLKNTTNKVGIQYTKTLFMMIKKAKDKFIEHQQAKQNGA